MVGFNQIGETDIDLDEITIKDVKSARLRLTLTLEKTQELFESLLDSDVHYSSFEPLFNIIKSRIQSINQDSLDIKIEDTAKNLADLAYINYGTAVWLNIPLDKCFLEVHKSNMTKLINFTGKPIYRPDGKILYDASYIPPNIKSILDLHSK